MTRISGGIAIVIVTTSWLAAIAAGLLFEYQGWHMVIADGNIVGGLAVAFLLAPFVFQLVQTIIGLIAIPFGLIAERGESQPAENDYLA